jgi:hypothetical protein
VKNKQLQWLAFGTNMQGQRWGLGALCASWIIHDEIVFVRRNNGTLKAVLLCERWRTLRLRSMSDQTVIFRAILWRWSLYEGVNDRWRYRVWYVIILQYSNTVHSAAVAQERPSMIQLDVLMICMFTSHESHKHVQVNDPNAA